MANDGFVQLPADGSGKLVDMSQVTSLDGATVKERQRVTIGGDGLSTGFAEVDSLTNQLSISDKNVAPLLTGINHKLAILCVLVYDLKQRTQHDASIDELMSEIFRNLSEGSKTR